MVAEDTHQNAQPGKDKKGSFWRELPVLIVVALVLALLIKSFVVQAFYIPSESMENTLLKNDRVLVNKLVYRVRDIERGDIVVFSGVDSWAGEVEFEPPANPIAGFFRWVGTALRRRPRREGLHQAGHRRPGRQGQVLRRGPHHGQRGAPRRGELSLSG